jgi:branched-chain amino acid transport system ATP-binding protein
MSLVLNHVTAGYGDAVVLRDLSLTVPDGSVAALLGANGAGKTTLLRVASGMLPTTTGQVTFDERDLTGAESDAFARAGVGHIPEGRSIFPTMTVRENLLLFAPKGEETIAIEKAVAAFPRLGERLAQRAGTLSGGEQQMLALARVYITAPRVVLVDEVSLGLAPKIVDEIFVFLQELVSQGTSLLLVEQYVTRALAMADYVYILKKGRLVFAGEPAEVDAQDVFEEYVGAAIA